MFAAIPFFQLRPYLFDVPGIGVTIPIDPWAILVMTGFFLGLEVAIRRGDKLKLERRDVVDGAMVIVGTGFYVGHLLAAFAYHPERLAADTTMGVVLNSLRALVFFWEGFSSTGGFIGALLGAYLYFYVFRKKKGQALRYADVIVFGFPVGWFFGRAGCAVVHDHIGKLTTFPLAMQFPEWHEAAGLRHELGLYEAAYMIPVALLFFYLGKKDRPDGFFLALYGALYAPVRFGFDFLRNQDLTFQDERYFGLTPAQYGMILMAIAAFAWLWRIRDQDAKPLPEA